MIQRMLLATAVLLSLTAQCRADAVRKPVTSTKPSTPGVEKQEYALQLAIIQLRLRLRVSQLTAEQAQIRSVMLKSDETTRKQWQLHFDELSRVIGVLKRQSASLR